MRHGIYAIRDNLAGSIIGGVQLHAHDAVAVRFFSDVANTPDTTVARHITDHSLVKLGYLDLETCSIDVEEGASVVLTGAQLRASQEAAASADSR